MYVLDQIRARAAADPRRLAMVFNGSPLSYGGLWRFVMGARAALAPHAMGRGFAILWVDNLLDCWILDLAFRSLGHDTAQVLNAEQLALFKDLPVACIVTLTSEPGKAVPNWPGVKHLTLSDPAKQTYAVADPLPDLPRETNGVGGHVKLTSGTTGRFKLVMTHFGAEPEAIQRRLATNRHLEGEMDLAGAATVVNTFNVGLWAGGYDWPIHVWCLGGAVVIEQSDNIERALSWPGINRTVALPFQLSKLMALPEGAFPFLPQMQLVVGGGALSPQLLRETARRLTPKIALKLGSTEITSWASTPVGSETDLRWYRLNPDRQVEVVSEAGDVLAPGQLGRVRVALKEGDATAYVGDPQSSAEVFKDGWFYSGDMGVLDGAGRLALYGRDADIIHLNGDKFPAEPWESQIRDKLGCEAVCALSGNWRTGVEQLHVFVESRRPIGQEALAEAVRSTVTGFEQVEAYVVESLPRTATGKVRRSVLAQMLHEGRLASSNAA
jgi:acyl-coenzyme A synthetase/AMP-(fatty) acid ligase